MMWSEVLRQDNILVHAPLRPFARGPADIDLAR
jgi:hypothetical protein